MDQTTNRGFKFDEQQVERYALKDGSSVWKLLK